MNGTDTAALQQRLTSNAVRIALSGTDKRHLIITGGRKTGKTTLLSQLFPHPTCGITTWAVPGDCVYLRENTTGRTAVIGRYDSTLSGTENKMRPMPDGFTGTAIPALHRCMQSGDEWITVDEIGYLDTACPDYCDTLTALMEQKRTAAVVRAQNLPFLRSLCERNDAFRIDLDAPFGNYGCVIMASGLGVRFGGNKLMADFASKPMIARALLATDGIFSRRVVVTRSVQVADYCSARGVDVILHDLPGRNDTVRLGLSFMDGMDGCMFCPGDQPLLTRDTVAALALTAANEKNAIVRPICGEDVGAPVLFPSHLFGELSSLPDGKGGGVVAKRHAELVRTLPVSNPLELADADTPDALAALAAQITE